MRSVGLALFLVILACSPVGSGAAGRSSATATATVTLTIETCGFATWMIVCPRCLDPHSCPHHCGDDDDEDDDDDDGCRCHCRPMVKCCIIVPQCIRGQGLCLFSDTLRLNDVPAMPAKAPPGPGDSYPLDCSWVEVYFDQGEVIDILGPPPGWRVLTLEGTITGGHSLTASDWVYLRPG